MVEKINGKFDVPFFLATRPPFSFFLLPLSSIFLFSIYTDMLFSSGFSGSPLEISRNKGSFLRSGSDLGVYGSSGLERVAASPGAFLIVLQTLCPVRLVLSVPVSSSSLHSSAFGAFGSGELLLFADRQWIFGCPVVKPLWRRESLTFVVALAFSSSLPTWYVADFCRFPTVCCHSVKLMSLVRLAVVDSPGVGSVCMC
ncbi:hypothetical protein Bca101_070576 [Brassica carinata]